MAGSVALNCVANTKILEIWLKIFGFSQLLEMRLCCRSPYETYFRKFKHNTKLQKINIKILCKAHFLVRSIQMMKFIKIY